MKQSMKRVISLILVFAMIISICPQMKLTDILAADNTPYCISQGRAVYSSSDNGNNTADNAVDGKNSTRWESEHGDKPQWLYVDLGKTADITGIHIKWEDAYAKSYKIQFSNDEENWEDAYIKGNGGTTPEETTALADITMSYTVGTNENGVRYVQANWTGIDNAKYKVCINSEDNVAVAPDGYKFTSHGINNGQIKLDPGTYTVIIIALDQNGNEITRGEREIIVPAEGETLQPETSQKETEPETEAQDKGEEDITITGQARYVRLYMTERATNYGYSLYEFQVYGLNGVTPRPEHYGENLALGKEVSCSGTRDEWWMNDGNNDEADKRSVAAQNAVDGDEDTSFTSYQDDKQWFYVDLGKSYEIGRIVLKWGEDAGKVYDIQVSEDAQNWTTVYRRLNGYAELVENLPIYVQSARYVRMNGYTKVANGSGFSIKELEVYEYVEGAEKVTYTMSELPERKIVKTKKGSYISNDIYLEKAKLPTYIDEENVKVPMDSNDWWQSAMIKKFGNTMCTLPFKTGYSKKGLSILTATEGWLPTQPETAVNMSVVTENTPDLYILPENLDTATAYDRVHDYSDYTVDLQLCDTNGVVMTSTHVKGSPYIFCDLTNREAFYLSVPNLTAYFDDNGNEIIAAGETITTDHIGIHVTDDNNKDKTMTSESFYSLNLPQGTKIKNNGGKLKITFSGNERYLSVGTMHNRGELKTFYEHGYAFVTDTKVTYSYNETMSQITSNYNVTTEVKRSGFSKTTMQLMLPHQWKHSAQDSETASVYTSVRGDMHGIWNNSFQTKDVFEGLLPIFAMPKSEEFDQNKVKEYLKTLDNATSHINPAADAYWEGKNLHPLGMGVLMADQLGETELRDTFLKRLKERLVDWFTYDGANDVSYFVYDKHWGTMYYGASEFGANWGICDHHFTYGYFVFGAVVLATYDSQFYNDYKDIIEILIRDYANPSDADTEYCRFRAYDLYEGHSWAGGYADNDNGNNQESASESLFSWVSMYLWGVLTENDTYRDAAVFGFKNEMEAIEQYWFDYDKDNWIAEWPYEVVAQVYGGENFYGTFFGGQPLYCYGIQWLPISEYLTYYGMNQERAAEIYAGLEKDTEDAKTKAAIVARAEGKSEEEIEKLLNEYASPDNGWQHITWPFLAQTDPQRAMEKFLANDNKVQNTDQANTYWFIQSMKELGVKTSEVIAVGDCSATVYFNKATNKYTATVWNPTDIKKTVSFKKADGTEVGTADIAAKSLVSFDVDTEKQFELSQVSTPKIKATSLVGGVVTEGVVGNMSFEDTQIVELSCVDEGAVIYYTTDGTTPTTASKVYTDKILVSSNATVKAIAVKEGMIDSSYASATLEINGDRIESSENLALNKEASASTENGGNKADSAVDGTADTRWESASTDAQYFQVDLDSVKAVNTVKINWEAAYAAKYEIQVSIDGEQWESVATENGAPGYVTTVFDAVKARYVRMNGVKRATDYGYSFYEFEVYGAVQAKAPAISLISGIYDKEQTVTMSTTVKGAEVKYTLDGSEPTEDSDTYMEPVTVTKSTIVKAVTYRKGMVLSDTTEASIIIKGTIALSKNTANIAYGSTLQLAAITDEAVTWSSDKTEIASVDENGLIKGKAEGTAVITATTVSGQKASCTVTVKPPVHITSIELSPATLTMKNKTSETLKVTINPADTTDDTTVTWSSDKTDVVVVNENGTLTAKSEGTATVTAKVGTFTATCQVTVGPAATIEEMIANENYNISLNKNVIISTIYAGEGSQDESTLVNGDLTDMYVSTDWDNSRTSEYIIIDLGANYETAGLDLVAMQFKADAGTFCNDYEIQYSSNGIEYITVAENTGVEYDSTQEGLVSINVGNASDKISNTRYVKINLKGHKSWGYQIREAAVFSTEQNAKVVQVEQCDNPSEFIVTSDNLCEITYTIVAGENQEGYTYMVYMNGEKVGENVKAGTYTLTDIPKGTYELQVISHYNGNTSSGIKQTVMVDDGSFKDYIDTERNLAKKGSITVDSIEIEHQEGSKDPNTLIDGKVSGDVVETVWGEKNAVITMDLENNYRKDQILEVILAFKADNTYAKNYTIQFSSDGENYEDVAVVENAEYSTLFETKVDTSSYTQDCVRYVRVCLNDGNYNWGYQIHEVAVISGEDYAPTEGLIVSKDVKVEGFQISTSYEGSKVVGSVEPQINGQTVKNWGLIYGITKVGDKTYNVTDADMYHGSSNAYVVSYESTSEGTIHSVMGESKTATYFARTMKFGANNVKAYSAEYKIRAYAVLEDGTYVYSDIAGYSVFRVARQLYENQLMNTYDGHRYLYNNILKVVDGNYQPVDYQWSNSVVGPQEVSATTDLKITGYQMTSNLNNIEGNMGLRVVYQAEPTIHNQPLTEVGLVYGLVYGEHPITESDVLYGSDSPYIKSYAATEEGKLTVAMGDSQTASYFVRTMGFTGEDGTATSSPEAYSSQYYVRAYAKLQDGSIVYSDVTSYTVFQIADYVYQNQLISRKNSWDYLYTKILNFVDSTYKEGDFDWSGVIVK